MTSATGSPTSASSSSRTCATPAFTFRKRRPPQVRHTGGRSVPHRRQRSCSSGCSTEAPHTSQRARPPHAPQASSRARPVRLRTQRTRWSDRSTFTSDGENRPAERGSSSRRSTTSTTGHPARSTVRVGSCRPATASASRLGHGDTRRHGTPACAARSSATSRAFHVGACSCWWASSCSSRTTIAARSATGVHAAARVPTTVAPAAPRAHPSGWRATSTPARSRREARPRAVAAVGQSTSRFPRAAAVRTTSTRSAAGGSRTIDLGSARAASVRAWCAAGGRGRPVTGGRAPTTRSGDAVRRNEARRPAQRHAAHSANENSSAGGPSPLHLAIGAARARASG